jgi:hypothetical protein
MPTTKKAEQDYAWLDAIIAEQKRIQASWGITQAMLADAMLYDEIRHNEGLPEL